MCVWLREGDDALTLPKGDLAAAAAWIFHCS